jgi:hypothetical protein
MTRAIAYVVAILSLWLAVLWQKPRIQSSFSQFALARSDRELHKVGNPLYPEMVKEAARWGLDVSFMKNPIHTRAAQLSESDLFTRLPGHYDVLVFGDSSLTWSFSPQLISQASGKQVAFFAAEGMLPDKGLIHLAERLARTYLRRDGTVVFLFAPWTWGMAPDGDQLADQIQQMVRTAASGAIREPIDLALDSIFGLPRLAVYGELVEPRFAPGRYAWAHRDLAGRGCTFYSWGAGTNAFMLYCSRGVDTFGAKDAHPGDLAASVPRDCASFEANGNVAANLRELVVAELPNKILALPFIDHPESTLRCEADKVKLNLRVLDLPRAAAKYGVTSLAFEMETHLANTASITASAILGRELAAPR